MNTVGGISGAGNVSGKKRSNGTLLERLRCAVADRSCSGVETARRGHRYYARTGLEALFMHRKSPVGSLARFEAQFSSDSHISRVGTVE
jgi:hypothetical protein